MGKLKNILWTMGVVIAILSSTFIYKFFLDTSIIGAFVLIAVLATLVLGAVNMYERFGISKNKSETIMNRTTVVESLRRVFKVITAEGHFAEIVDFKDTKVSSSLFKSTKKALIIVKGKVQMGYDFSEMEWEIDEVNCRISIKKIPEIKILSNSTDINYYNMENGIFNKFKPADLNLIKDQCISQIEEVAWQSELPHAALEQANVLLAEIGKMHKWEITPLKLIDAQG